MKFKTYIDTQVISIKGNHRAINEDNYYVNGVYLEPRQETVEPIRETQLSAYHLMGVFDGMGGEKCGEIASYIAAKGFLSMEHALSIEHTNLNLLIQDFVRGINRDIVDEMHLRKVSRMGSTLAGLLIEGDQAYAINLGDSRIYMYRRGLLSRLSVDHTEANLLIKLGVLTEESAKNHHSKHRLTQHLGVEYDGFDIEAEISNPIKLMTGDYFLLCSDGLYEHIGDKTLQNVMEVFKTSEERLKKLIQIAIDSNSRDNITVMGVEVLKIKNKWGIKV